MRYVAGTLEALLALLFISAAVTQVIKGNLGAVSIAACLLIIAFGGWLAKKAVDNFRAKP